jgi:monodictyphenone polyketide synthase
MEVNTSSPLSLESWTSGMHLLHFANEFPHDDLQNTLRKVYSNSKDSSYPLLAQFLHCATRAVYDEVERLPRSLRDIIPPFESFLDWAGNAELRNGQLCGSIDGVLLVLLQLATFIAYYSPRSRVGSITLTRQ